MSQSRRAFPTLLAVLAFVSTAAAADPLPMELEWGSTGRAPSEFDTPIAIAASGSDVYVADFENRRIQRFRPDGTFLLEWRVPGNGPDDAASPVSVAVDGHGDVYVADLRHHRIQKFTSEGVAITRWGSWGRGPGQFDGPYGIAIDRAGHVLVSDLGNHRIQKFSAAGAHLATWGVRGSERGQFREPWGIAVDATGAVYVADHGNHRIQKFSADGALLQVLDGKDRFSGPAAVAVRPSGAIYVVDRSGDRLQKLAADGALLWTQDGLAPRDGEGFPHKGIATGSEGRIFVADAERHRVGVHVDASSDFTPREPRVPVAFGLVSARPNPSDGPTSLRFGTPREGRLTVGVFDVSGRLVRQLEDRRLEAGEHLVDWDGRSGDGRPVPAGVYLVRASFRNEVENRTLNRRLVMLR